MRRFAFSPQFLTYLLAFLAIVLVGVSPFETVPSFGSVVAGIQRECRQESAGQCGPGRQTLQIQQALCEKQLQDNNCDEYFRQSGEPAELYGRQCDLTSICTDTQFQDVDFIKGCAGGFTGVLVDTGEALLELRKTAKPTLFKFLYLYVNSSDSERLSLLANYTQKVADKDYKKAAEEWLEKQNIRMACYNTEMQAELACYGFFSVFDPTAAAGYLAKLPRVERALLATKMTDGPPVEKRKVPKAAEQKSPADEVARTKVRGDKSKFITAYLHRDPTTAKQNEAWIAAAEKSDLTKGGSTFFIEVENAKLKELNDSLGDKNLVTSLNNLYKEIFNRRMRELAEETGGEVLVYSDFKAMRYSFNKSASPELLEKIDKVYKKTNAEFAERIKAQKLLRSTDPDPTKWFRAGYGKTADEASSAARYARREQGELSLSNFHDQKVSSHYATSLERTKNLHQSIETKIGSTPLMEGLSEGKGKALSLSSWELIRKSKSAPELSKKMKARYGVSIDENTSADILEYAHRIDEFSPHLRIATREVANLDGAAQGGLSVDFAGMGAKNQSELAKAIASSERFDDVISRARMSERGVTEAFRAQKNSLSDLIHDTLHDRKKAVLTTCSGDDCVSLPASPLDFGDKVVLVDNIAKQKGRASGYRLSFIPPKVPAEARTAMGVHGETVEKYLRENLEGKLPQEALSNLIFAIDMDTTKLGSGRINLIVGKGSKYQLSTPQRELIDAAFKDSVKGVNEGFKSNGIKAKYQTGRTYH